MSFDFSLPDGWCWKTLEQVKAPGRSIVSGPFGSNIGKRFFVEKGVPVIRGNNLSLSMNRFSDEGFVFLTEEKAQEFKNCEAITDDIIFTAAGTIGQVGIIPSTADYKKYIISNKQLRARLDTEIISPLFAYYWLASTLMVEFIKNRNTGSTIPLINLSVLRSLPIPLPPMGKQNAIVSILSALDDRISLLRETNKTLESIAQAIFKSWFVDFDPVRAKQKGREPEGMDADTAALFPDSFEDSELGLIPKGWAVKTIGDVCDFQNGYAFKSNDMTKSTINTYKIFKMGNIKKGGGLNRSGTKDYFEKQKSINLDRYLVKKGDLLMCMTDMKNNVALLGHTALMDTDDEFLLNQRVGLLRSKDMERANFPFLYILTNRDFFIEDLRSRANSGVQVNLSTTEIKNTKFILPAKKVHQKFNQITELIQEKIFLLEQQQDSLSDIRDTLLPRLISGQLRLPEAEELVSEATS